MAVSLKIVGKVIELQVLVDFFFCAALLYVNDYLDFEAS